MKIKFTKIGFILFLGITFSGCTKELEQKVTQLEKDKTELQSEIEQKNKYVEEITAAMNDIQGTLSAIRQKQQTVSKATTDIESTPKNSSTELKQNIIDGLTDIDNYILENRKKMAQLQSKMNEYRKKMNDYKSKMEGLEVLVSNLQSTIVQKEQEITQLKTEVERLNVEVKNLTVKVTEKESVIQQQESELRKGYYIVSTEEQLKEKGVIKKQGGFLGIGRATVTGSDFDVTHFTRIDILSFTELKVSAAKEDVKVLTNHETASYEIIEAADKTSTLKIKNPTRFWEKSKFLIITTD
ncbi:MAG: hypothetical protein SFU91_05130 [Chloroherpetonaceae bacterium]|nr:hypothetical protein [Chloroherpetonaceae bacterium]